MRAWALLVAAMVLPSAAMAQNFSCSIGDTPACLGYGDKVCSSLGKCVDESAACFDSYQCNYEGFTCKSYLTECGDEYDRLLVKYNSLVDDYNSLLDDGQELSDAISDLEFELARTRDERDELRSSLIDAESCLYLIDRVEDAPACLD